MLRRAPALVLRFSQCLTAWTARASGVTSVLRGAAASPTTQVVVGDGGTILASTDGGATFEKVLYKDEYTSANDVHIDPSDPMTVPAWIATRWPIWMRS